MVAGTTMSAGGGFLVYYQATTGRVLTIDGRETAPQAMGNTAFVDPVAGTPLPFPEAVTSGLSVGIPGTPATWAQALDRFGTITLAQALRPAIAVAENGVTVDPTFQQQTAVNAARFAHFSSTAALFLPGGQPPAVGSTLRNPDLAKTYRQLARNGVDWLYRGPLAAEIVATVRRPPLAAGDTYHARPGLMAPADLLGLKIAAPVFALLTAILTGTRIVQTWNRKRTYGDLESNRPHWTTVAAP